MSPGRRAPRLLVKAVSVTFSTVAVLLVLVFLFVRMSVRDQVRLTVTQNLAVSQQMLAALEARRLHELRNQAETLAENPTLKAAMDTYTAETLQADTAGRLQLIATIQRELDKLAGRVESDAIALANTEGDVLAVAGRLAGQWPTGRSDTRVLRRDEDAGNDEVLQAGTTLFRVVHVPLTLDDGATIGWLDLGSALDAHYAEMLDRLSHVRTAIVRDTSLVATTLTPAEARDFAIVAKSSMPAELERIELDGASHAGLEIAHIGDVRIYALSSVDAVAAAPLARVNTALAGLALGAFALALLGSVGMARLLSEPIERLSLAMDQMATVRDLARRLPTTGSSRELDLLTSTFNQLMASVADADSRTEAAYAGAIRALAAALDARDPYTAGHSERVGVLSVAIGRVLRLPDTDLEILRLGSLLHDIGKIGIPDAVLRKPGPLTREEFGAVMQHPVVGARILRTIPFLQPHLAIVELHHERPDGRGYPKGLQGEDIPLLARVVHVADAYDAMTSERAYRQARSSDEALRELWRCSGTEYHAEIVGALARALPRLTPLAPDLQALQDQRSDMEAEALSA